MNIALIGYRCCGKTSVARLLSERLGWPYVDTDYLIEERTGVSIEEFVEKYGWKAFRRIERDVVLDVANRDYLVIATGGGVVTDDRNVHVLRKNSWVVWLMADQEVIKERMNQDNGYGKVRPSLTGQSPMEEIAAVLEKRKPLYEKAQDFKVDTSHFSPGEIVDLIIENMPGYTLSDSRRERDT